MVGGEQPVPAQPSRSRALALRLVIYAAVVAVVLLARGRRLDSLGEFTAGPDAQLTFHVANRSDQPREVRATGRDKSAVELFVPGRSRATLKLPALDEGRAHIEMRSVLTEGPGCIDRTVKWTTIPDEELLVTIEADGSETCEFRPSTKSGASGIAFSALTAAPVLVFYEDLAAAGGAVKRDKDGQPVPEWIGAGIHSFTGGSGLAPGVDVRVRYRITALSEPVLADVDGAADGSHQLVIGADGSTSVGSVSLATRAGF